MIGPSDMYGDLSAEDVEDEFEGLEPDDEREIAPDGRFQRVEFRSFEQDFSYDLDSDYDEDGNELGAETEAEFDILDEAEINQFVREVE